jgi:hypothetical protein
LAKLALRHLRADSAATSLLAATELPLGGRIEVALSELRRLRMIDAEKDAEHLMSATAPSHGRHESGTGLVE